MCSNDLNFSEAMRPYTSLLKEAGAVVVGYSGGADSSCLLRLMQPWCREKHVRLAAAHVHHGIRGDDADCDEAFCRQTCAELGIEYFSIRADVPALAIAEKSGLEETARRVRYAFFDEVSEKLTGSPSRAIVATAHNADDNLETVLFHLLRGSGLRGLCGIDPLRDGRYLRPLLKIDSVSIRRWCEENRIPYVTDATNTDTEYTRNRIRHTVLPALRSVAPHPTTATARLTALLRQDNEYLEAEAAKYAESTTISRKTIVSLHPAVASRVVRQLYENRKRLSADAQASQFLAEKHIRQALELLQSSATHASLSFPGKIQFVVERDAVRFQTESDRNSVETSDRSAPVFNYPNDGGVFRNDLCVVRFSPGEHIHHIGNDKLEENIYKLSILTTLRFDKIIGVLRIRYRVPGDTVRYGGMTHRVKRMFSDRKLSERERALCPILYDDDGIVWIPGFPPRDGMAYTGEGEPLTICCASVSE